MAFITGTAANHTALWTTLLDFLQNNAALVAAGQNWTVAWEKVGSPELVLKGPGLSGTDEVYVGLKRVDQRFLPDESEIQISGCTGILSGAVAFNEHVNSLVRTPRMFLDTNPMQYWMVASGRRFIVVVKISTVYQAMYGGFFLPYGTPSAYPYPMFIGATAGYSGASDSYFVSSWRESEQDAYSHFIYPLSSNPTATWNDSQAFTLSPEGVWLAGTRNPSQTPYALGRFVMGPRGFPEYMAAEVNNDTGASEFLFSGNQRFGYGQLRERIMAGLNGELPLSHATLMRFESTPSPNPSTYGVLDGAFSVAGVGNSAEAVVTIGAIDHLVVPNVMRTGTREYWALALE